MLGLPVPVVVVVGGGWVGRWGGGSPLAPRRSCDCSASGVVESRGALAILCVSTVARQGRSGHALLSDTLCVCLGIEEVVS